MDLGKRDRIRSFAAAALCAADARHRTPTPLDDVMTAASLISTDDLEAFQEAPSSWFEAGRRKLSAKLRGFLAAKEGIIWVDPDMRHGQRRFTVAHEIGHSVIPWQRAAYTCDTTAELAPDVDEEFEKEANAFASDLLFNVDDFMHDALGGPLSLTTPACLSEKYEASLIATSRRFVEEHAAECALLVLGRFPTTSMGRPGVRLLYGVQSRTFEDRFGPVLRGLRLPVAWPRDWHQLASDSFAAVSGTSSPLVEGRLLAPTGDAFRYELFAARPYPFVLLVPPRKFLPRRQVPEIRWRYGSSPGADPLNDPTPTCAGAKGVTA